MPAKKEKVFEFFFNVPEEVRREILNELAPEERCRLTPCSKLCQKEAKASKKFMYGLEIEGDSEESITIKVAYGDGKKCYELQGNYLKFRNLKGTKYLACYTTKRHFWRNELSPSTNLVQAAVEHFKGLLKLYQNTIRRFEISGTLFSRKLKKCDFGIKTMRNLEHLEIHSQRALSMFAKLRRPLQNLTITDEGNYNFLANCEELYHVRDTIIAFKLQLTNEQLRRLSAKTIQMHIGKLTAQEITDFIKDWKPGNIGKDLVYYKWYFKGSQFNRKQLFRNFGVRKLKLYTEIFMNHEIESAKTGVLNTVKEGDSITFQTFVKQKWR